MFTFQSSIEGDGAEESRRKKCENLDRYLEDTLYLSNTKRLNPLNKEGAGSAQEYGNITMALSLTK